MMIEALGRAIQADRERGIREALRVRALAHERSADTRTSRPEPVEPARPRGARPRHADPATTA